MGTLTLWICQCMSHRSGGLFSQWDLKGKQPRSGSLNGELLAHISAKTGAPNLHAMPRSIVPAIESSVFACRRISRCARPIWNPCQRTAFNSIMFIEKQMKWEFLLKT